MESLQQVFYQSGMSQRMAAIIVTAIIVPLSQVCLPRNCNQLICAQCCSRACEKGSKQDQPVELMFSRTVLAVLLCTAYRRRTSLQLSHNTHASAVLPSQLFKQHRWIRHEH